MKRKHILSVLGVSLFAFLFYASKTQQKTAATPEAAPETFTFNYQSSSAQKPNSTDMIIDLLNPVYKGFDQNIPVTPLYQDYQQAIQADFKELLIDKGFTVGSETYNSLNQMVFGAKKNCDIVMVIHINPGLSLTGGFSAKYPFLLSARNNIPPSYYAYMGGINSSGGEIDILGIEPMTQQTVWEKSVPIPQLKEGTINIDPGTHFSANMSLIQLRQYLFTQDPTFHNALGTALSENFQSIFKQIDAYIDPHDLEGLKPEIKELKSKKAY